MDTTVGDLGTWPIWMSMQRQTNGAYAQLATNTETVLAAIYETVMAHDRRKAEGKERQE